MGAHRWLRCCGLAMVLLASGPVRAEQVPFSGGRLTLRFGTLYGAASPPVSEAALSGSLEVTRAGDGSIAALALPASLFQASTRVSFVGPGPFPPALGVDLDFANAAGTLAVSGAGTGSAFGGTMPLLGVHKVCLFFACGDPLATTLSVPLGVVGAGGIASVFDVLRVAIAGDVWSTGSVTVDVGSGATSMVTGGIVQTAGGASQIQLVAPVMLSTNAVLPNDQDAPPVRGLGVLTLVVAPEPGRAAVLAMAVASLVAVGAYRSRRTRRAPPCQLGSGRRGSTGTTS